jgi:hypothetical protein
MAAISKEPESTTAIYLSHKTNAPKSRIMFKPEEDVYIGHLAVVFMLPTDEEREWMEKRNCVQYYQLIRVTALKEVVGGDGKVVPSFKGVYYQPTLPNDSYYHSQTPWPAPEDWVTGTLGAIKVKGKGRAKIDWETQDPIALDNVQFSASLVQGKKSFYKKFQPSVLEAVRRCQGGGINLGERVCEDLDEGGAEE